MADALLCGEGKEGGAGTIKEGDCFWGRRIVFILSKEWFLVHPGERKKSAFFPRKNKDRPGWVGEGKGFEGFYAREKKGENLLALRKIFVRLLLNTTTVLPGEREY